MDRQQLEILKLQQNVNLLEEHVKELGQNNAREVDIWPLFSSNNTFFVVLVFFWCLFF